MPLTGGLPHTAGPRPRDDAGAVAVLVAAFSVVILGLAAIVVDLGFARDRVAQAQTAADAAALAAAQYLSTRPDAQSPSADEQEAARQLAMTYVEANGWQKEGTQVDLDLKRFVVRVTLPEEASPSFFARAIGGSAPDVSRSASAKWGAAAAGACALCVFSDLDVQNADITVQNGSVSVSGNITIGPTGHLTAPGNGSTITYGGEARDISNVSPSPVFTADETPDPFDDVELPEPKQKIAPSPKGRYCKPGTYTDVSDCDSFSPGVFTLTGATVFKGPKDYLYAQNVAFYLVCSKGGYAAACDPGQTGGTIDIQGKAHVVIDAPTAGSPLAGFGVVADRNNTGQLLWIHGNSDLLVQSGSIYLRNGHVRQNGNPALTVANSMVIGSWEGEGTKDSFVVQGKDQTGPVGSGLDGPVRLIR